MRLEKYFRNIQQDLKLFFFVLALLCLYRVLFMWWMSAYMGEGAGGDAVALALWAGLRLSLKTAGAVAPSLLLAVSAGAVFMGAVTYIGNAPNFMVKNIAEKSGVKMPSFFGYMVWSCAILVPLFIVDTVVFFL